MSRQEINIVTKIVRELTLYFMLQGVTNIKMETFYESKGTMFVVNVKTLDARVLDEIHRKISRERELEIETYGWELIGDIDSKSGLEILGHLIDEIHIKQGEATTTLTFVRKNRYKQKKGPRI